MTSECFTCHIRRRRGNRKHNRQQIAKLLSVLRAVFVGLFAAPAPNLSVDVLDVTGRGNAGGRQLQLLLVAIPFVLRCFPSAIYSLSGSAARSICSMLIHHEIENRNTAVETRRD